MYEEISEGSQTAELIARYFLKHFKFIESKQEAVQGSCRQANTFERSHCNYKSMIVLINSLWIESYLAWLENPRRSMKRVLQIELTFVESHRSLRKKIKV